jgi:hypothetical protein
LRKVQQQELGTVAEVKKEIGREAEHEATFEKLKELLYGEAKREGSVMVESSSDGFEKLDVASLPSLQRIFDGQDIKKGRPIKEEK